MNNQDTLLSLFSDFHSGGSTALFVDRQFTEDEHQQPVPNKRQREIYQVFAHTINYASQARKGKRLVVVHNGDAIEGLHHNSTQMSVFSTRSQAKIHKELMNTFLAHTEFNKENGDRLFYVRGTETHVNDVENDIAEDLGAERGLNGLYVHDHLELLVNGRKIWFVHHGPRGGKGANEGNALRNWLRDIYYDAMKVGVLPPDMVVSGHVHTANWNVFIAREEGGFHMMHGIILPSWQSKTRYAYKAAPVERNEVGAVFVEIKADGEIKFPQFVLEETQTASTIAV